MSEFDTTALLEDIRERGRLPANDLDYTDALLLKAATRELRDGVAPLLVQTRAEHLVYPYSVPGVAGTATYRMPTRAAGGALRDVVWVDASGTALPGLRQISSDTDEATRPGDGTPSAYFTRNYTVVLVPTPNMAGTVRMPYYARPNRLVAPADCSVIDTVTVDGSNYVLEVTAEPPAPMQAAGVEFELVRATPGFETLVAGGVSFDGTITFNVSVSSLELAPEPGDYVCVKGTSPVPQVPVELHGLLAARTARRVVGAVGDDALWQTLDREVNSLEDSARAILSPRVAGDTQQAGGSVGASGLVAGTTNWVG